MAIRIQPYSDGSGNVALPTRRMQGMSSAQMNSASAVGRSLQNFGQGVANFGQSLAKVEINRMQDEARVDVLNKTAQMQAEWLEFDDQLRRNPGLASQHGGPGTSHTQALQNWFDTRLQDDDMAPVNHFAEQMWAEQGIQLRSNITNQGIKFEAQQRIANVAAGIDNSLDTLEMSVYTNPELFEQAMQNWTTYTGPDGGIQVGAIDGPEIMGDTSVNPRYLNPTALSKISSAGQARLATAYLNGLVRDDPMRALQMIDGGALDEGRFYGMELSTLMTIRGRAFAAASVVNEASLTQLENNLAAHLSSRAAGGDGLPMFSQPETIEAAVMSAFGGPDVLSYFPQNQARAEAIISGLRSDLRVANTTGLILNSLRYASPDTISNFMRYATDVAANSDVTGTSITSNSLFGPPVGDNPLVALSQLPADEGAKVIDGVVSQLRTITAQRGTDPVGWATTHPSMTMLTNDMTQAGQTSIYSGTAPTTKEDFAIYARGLDTVYETSNQPANARPLLSTTTASGMVSSILAERNANVLVATIMNMQETYGEYFPRVWQQLVTQDDGLGSQYMFLATIGNSRGMEIYAQALINDTQTLEQYFPRNGQSYANVLDTSKTLWHGQNLTETLTGGLAERLPEASRIAEVIYRTVPLIMALEGLNEQDAFNAAYSRMFGDQSRISHLQGDHHNLLITTGLVDERGNALFGPNVEAGVTAMFSERRIMDGTLVSVLAEKYQGGTIVMPGSVDPIMQASLGIRTTQTLEEIFNTGQLVMNDDSTGFYLTVRNGQIGREPIMVNIPQANGTIRVEPLSIPLWYFNRPDWQWTQTHYSPFPIPENENPE